MTLKQYLTIMILATIMCWVSWGVVIVNVDPEQSSVVGFLFFYISLFLSILGSASIIMFTLYYLISRDKFPIFKYVQTSFRDASIFSALIIAVLFLLSQNILNWWNLGILIAIGVFTLILSISKKKVIQN